LSILSKKISVNHTSIKNMTININTKKTILVKITNEIKQKTDRAEE